MDAASILASSMAPAQQEGAPCLTDTCGPEPLCKPMRRNGKWTPEEDLLLRRIVEASGTKKWREVAAHFPEHTQAQVQHRWQKVLRPDLKRGPWTPEEDAVLRRLVAEAGGQGSVRWSIVAASLPGRLGKQCRERWINACAPGIRLDAWTEEEDRIV